MKSLILQLSFLIFGVFMMAQNTLKINDFESPSPSNQVYVYWFWLNGSITKNGITKDLESMKKQGISEASIFDVLQPIGNQQDILEVKFGTPEWYNMFQWALKEATRLGIKIGIHNCNGWSQTGGPWVTPEQSMKKYVWTKTIVDGGKNISIQLPLPQIKENYYRDFAVLAFPYIQKETNFKTASPIVSINNKIDAMVLSDGNPLSTMPIQKGDYVMFNFSNELTTNKIAFLSTVVHSWENLAILTSVFTLSSSNDGKIFKKIQDLKFNGVNNMVIVDFPKTTARYFKLECKNWPVVAKENMNNGNDREIAEVEFLNDNESPTFSPKIPYLMIKTQTVKAITESNFDLTEKNEEKGIAKNAIINLTSFVTPEGKLNWKAPKGRWGIIRFGYTSTARKNKPAREGGVGLEVDKMDTAALNSYFTNFPEKLVKAAGEYTGNTFKFLTIDSWECHFQNWTHSFADEFKKRRGYDITPWIPVLCGELIENTQISEGFIHDYRQTISDLIDQNFYKHYSTLCHRKNLRLYTETGKGEYPQIDVLKTNLNFDMPMTEFWARQYPAIFPDYKPINKPTPHFPAFAAFDGNKQIIGAEAYTGFAHYSESPVDLKPYGDQIFCSGINQMVMHCYVHQPSDKKPGVTLGQFGSTINRNNPWFEFSRGWMDYQARIQYVLQKGEPAIDVVLYIGDQFPQSLKKSVFNEMPYGYTSNPCNFDMLKNNAKIIDGKLSFGGKQRYAFLALPNKINMELKTLKRIAELVYDGGVVYGPKPLEMLSLQELENNTADFKELTNKLWGTSNNKIIENTYGKGKVICGKPLATVLDDLGVKADFSTSNSDPQELMYIHKIMNDSDIYFVFNQQNKPLNRELIFRVEGKTPEIWNPENGTVKVPAIFTIEQNQLRIPVSFKPRESMIFVFKKGKPENFIQQVICNGEKIFPKNDSSESIIPIPQANLKLNMFEFTADLKGNYTFLTNKNQVINKSLIKPEVFEIANFKGVIKFSPINNDSIQAVDIKDLKSLTEFENPAIKYFAGKAKYIITFDISADYASKKDSIVLSIGKIDATAEVRLNGKQLGYAWMPNSTFPVSNLLAKNNTIEITVATVCVNRFIGDLIQFGSVKSLWTTSNVAKFLNADRPLKPSGLIGPLKLIKYVKQ